MAQWFLEPGHTAAEFRVMHMMVTPVRGHFKNVRGSLEFDPEEPRNLSVEVVIDARGIWTGEEDRDAHLRSADFLDTENHPEISFRSKRVELLGANHYEITGDLTIRGTTRETLLTARYLGQWRTPWWEDGVDKGPKTRAGFSGETSINRQDFGVRWQSPLEKGGIVVGNRVDVFLDAEAVKDRG